jgi:hypothetical protein
MIVTVTCKLCEQVIGQCHKGEVSGLRVNHLQLVHPAHWDELDALRKKATKAQAEYVALRWKYGVTTSRGRGLK